MSSPYINDSDTEDLGSEEWDLEESYLEEQDLDDNEVGSVRGLKAKIFSTLEEIKTPNAFSYSTVDPFLPNPVLYLPAHGTLGLPLSTDDAQKIISQASQSPFGRGEDTLIDTTVRKSWELNPNQFSLKNPEWNKGVQKILDTVLTKLGLKEGTGKVSAELYKLLLYEPGAFFKPHKDSEKAPGMFATLVVCLPSPHEGGKLVLTHDNEKYEFETASSSSYNISYAAWYADITHEVQPVVSGYRLILTYNLIRQTDYKVPLYDLVCGRVKQLLTLLEEYDSQLKKKEGKLPPILLHKLAHKYTQASLKVNALKPPDLAQVQTLAQLSTKLGFDIYLATLELEIMKPEDDDTCEIKRSHVLKKVVELDGKLVVESLAYPKDALIDPTPQEKDDADDEEHEGYTGNAGCTVTYWYRDTVAVLVPPSERLNFAFQFQSSGTIVDPLFCKLMQEISEDPAQKAKLEQLCELALKQKPITSWHGRYFSHEISDSESIPCYFQQAAATALKLGRLDLFDEACKGTRNTIILINAHMLGGLANGVMCDRLIKGMRSTSSVTKKIQFLKAVSEGFETVVPKPSSAEIINLKQWSDQAIFTDVAELSALTNDDGMSLAQLCKTMDWNYYEAKTEPIILKAVTMTKIAFIKELMSTLQQELDEKHRSFIEMIIQSIWNHFVFDAKCHKIVPQSKKPEYLNENDVLHILENTITILPSDCVETIVIPAMLTAIRVASKQCAKELFLLLVQMILKNELPGFSLPTTDAIPPPSHKRFVQALLTKFLLENICLEPPAPTNWFLPAGPCSCSDCSVVNRFLQNPIKESFDFPCAEARRRHLKKSFTDLSTYDITTVKGPSPYIWRITKHRRGYQAAKLQWMKDFKNITQTLSMLKKFEPVNGRLEAYLQPYYNVIMNANFRGLRDLKFLMTTPHLSETSENTASAHSQLTNQTNFKREANSIHLPENEPAKRTKS